MSLNRRARRLDRDARARFLIPCHRVARNRSARPHRMIGDRDQRADIDLIGVGNLLVRSDQLIESNSKLF